MNMFLLKYEDKKTWRKKDIRMRQNKDQFERLNKYLVQIQLQILFIEKISHLWRTGYLALVLGRIPDIRKKMFSYSARWLISGKISAGFEYLVGRISVLVLIWISSRIPDIRNCIFGRILDVQKLYIWYNPISYTFYKFGWAPPVVDRLIYRVI